MAWQIQNEVSEYLSAKIITQKYQSQFPSLPARGGAYDNHAYDLTALSRQQNTEEAVGGIVLTALPPELCC